VDFLSTWRSLTVKRPPSNTCIGTKCIVLDLPQLYTKPSAESLLHTLALLTSAPLSWDRANAGDDAVVSQVQVNPEGVTRYLTSIVSSSLKWIEDEDAKGAIWDQASARLSERSGRTAMGAISRTFRIPTATDPFDLTIHEPTMTGDDLGLKTWAASYMLAKRLHTFDLVDPHAQPKLRVLELGAGTGLVGLAMAGLGANVLLTDMASIHSNLARNARANADVVEGRGGSLFTGILDWTRPTVCETVPHSTDETGGGFVTSRFPIILAADSLYSPDHPQMLVDTIHAWLVHDSSAKVIIELPYRDAYLPQIEDFRHRMISIGLRILDEGEEKGYDDWGSAAEDEALVTCWWSCWGRQSTDSS
jgi:D-xylulose reductase